MLAIKAFEKISNLFNKNELKVKVINIKDDIEKGLIIFLNGNFIEFKNTFLMIKDIENYYLIKKSYYTKEIKVNDSIPFSKDEIIICDKYYNISYIKLDNNFNIKKMIFKNIMNNNYNIELYDTKLKYLKNGKFAYLIKKKQNSTYAYEYKNTEINILSYKNNELIYETKIEALNDIYIIKSRKEYLLFYFDDNRLKVANSNNFKIKKEFKIQYNDLIIKHKIQLINDNLFFYFHLGDLYLRDLINMKIIEKIDIDEIYGVYKYKNNTFLTFERVKTFFGNEKYYLRKYEINKKEKKIKLLAEINLDDYFQVKYSGVKSIKVYDIKGCDNLFLIFVEKNYIPITNHSDFVDFLKRKDEEIVFYIFRIL